MEEMLFVKVRINKGVPELWMNKTWKSMKKEHNYFVYYCSAWERMYEPISAWQKHQQEEFLSLMYQQKFIVIRDLVAVSGRKREEINQILQQWRKERWLEQYGFNWKKTPTCKHILEIGMEQLGIGSMEIEATHSLLTQEIRSKEVRNEEVRNEKVRSSSSDSQVNHKKSQGRSEQKKQYSDDSMEALLETAEHAGL